MPVALAAEGHRLVLLPAAAYDVRFTAPADSLGFAFDLQTGSHAIGSDRSEPYFRLPNSLALTPRGCDVRSSSPRGGEYLVLSGPSIRAPSGGYRTNIRDRAALPAAMRLRKWLLSGDCPGDLDLEAAIRALSGAVQGTGTPDKASRWMTPARFRRVADLIEANLSSSLTVARLAREIGVSASFLSRAFSAFCGQTPYDYILSRRLQRARRLIATTGGSLPEIALQAGFSSQSHMTSCMKARLGVGPSSIDRPSI